MKPVAALIYDFDKTLSPRDMQEYAFIPDVGMTPAEFWARCDQMAAEHKMDPILAYMLFMVQAAKGRLHLTPEVFHGLGRQVEFFPGVMSWFDRITAYGESQGMTVEHYIVSSGLREIIEGTSIADKFEKIYAASYYYGADGEAAWPAMAVNYTSKTQFLYRINKGVLDAMEHAALNEFMPDSHRRVPFANMIYIGDGYTDVPSMKLVRTNGGHSIAVYEQDDSVARELLRHGRVDYTAVTDYSAGGRIETVVKAILDKICADTKALGYHFEDIKNLNDCTCTEEEQ